MLLRAAQVVVDDLAGAKNDVKGADAQTWGALPGRVVHLEASAPVVSRWSKPEPDGWVTTWVAHETGSVYML